MPLLDNFVATIKKLPYGGLTILCHMHTLRSTATGYEVFFNAGTERSYNSVAHNLNLREALALTNYLNGGSYTDSPFNGSDFADAIQNAAK